VFSREEAEKRRRKDGPRSRGFICAQDEKAQRAILKEFQSHEELGWVTKLDRSNVDPERHVQPVFAAIQRNKIRSIVDASFFNQKSIETDRLSLPTGKVLATDLMFESSSHSIDISDSFSSSREISAIARRHTASLTKKQKSEFSLDAAVKFFRESLPSIEFKGHENIVWRGVSMLALDFSNAYRQLCTQDPDLNLLEIWDPDQNVFHLYTSNVLTFGSIGSVYAWTRISLLVEKCIEHYFGITVYIYIDDLPAILPDETGDDMVSAIVGFIELLGFQLKAEKRQYGKSVRALGVNYVIEPHGFHVSVDEQAKSNLVESVSQIKSLAAQKEPIPAKLFRSVCGHANFMIVSTFLTHLRFAVAPFFAFTSG